MVWENAGLIERLPTGFRHVELTRCYFLSVPGPVATQRHLRATIHLRDEPQCACRCHDQTKRVSAYNTLPLTTLVLPEPVKGVTVTDGNFHGPAVAVLRTISAALNVRSVVKKASMAGGGFLCPGRLGAGAPGRRSTTTRTRCPGNTGCHRPSQAWISAPASLGWGAHPVAVWARVLGEPIRSPFLRGAPRRLGGGRGQHLVELGADGEAPYNMNRLGQPMDIVLVA